MRIFEPHIHMYSRTTSDYEAMAKAGIEMVVEPAFWLGGERKYAGTFYDYFDHICGYENQRAAMYGIKQYVTISVNPKEANNKELAAEVFKELPRFLERDVVVAVGEIGLDAITPAEEEFFIKQAELAREFQLPIMVHTPHLNKYEGVRRSIKILREMDYPMEKVDMDHNIEETTTMSRKAGMWLGYTLYPISKMTPERMVHILEEHGYGKMMVNSSADWGPSDPLMVPHLVDELLERGHKRRDVEKLVWDNPLEFFGQSGRIR